jgi:predicted ATP-grasp superfamily ATP-dependent carboligase
MATTVLLVSTAAGWFGTARMPRSLARAGFNVVLLAPRGSLAEKSRYVSRIQPLDDPVSADGWLGAFAEIVASAAPRLLIPCDDMALQLLLELVTLQDLGVELPSHLRAAMDAALGALIRESLGDPAHYRDSIDKTLLPLLAQSIGVDVAPFVVTRSPDEVRGFAQRHGFPVVVKRRFSSAGSGVAVCASAEELCVAMDRFARPVAQDLVFPSDGAMLAQAYVQGRTVFYPSMAWRGSLLAGYGGEKLQSAVGPTSPPTVNRYFRAPALRNASVRLASAMGITGFYSPEFVEDTRTGSVYLMEINRRLVGGAHRGTAIGVDHCAALYAAMHATPPPMRTDLDEGEEHYTVHFPQEWLRDPASHWLRDYPVDVPWDEPELIEAMLAMRRK